MLIRMTLDDPKAQEKLTSDERRTILRAFADRMLLKTAAMDDPADMPGVERAVRVMAVIERVYSRCDRSEAHAPDPRKLEAERARNAKEAIQARIHLAGTLQWGEDRRKDLGKWWDAAETTAQKPIRAPTLAQAPAQMPSAPVPLTMAETSAAPTPKAATEAEPAPITENPVTPPAPAEGFKINHIDYAEAADQRRIELGLDKPPEMDLAEQRRALRSRMANLGLDDPPD